MWVQRCALCGYCAPSISEAMPDTRRVVESTEYRALLEHSGFPELARSFLCSSLVFQKCGERVAAARTAVEAAWACDDEGAVAESIHCRVLAVRLLRECFSDRDSVLPDPHTGRAVIADLLRRAELFDDAIAVIDDVVEGVPGGVAKMLAFSRLRALARDPGRYTVDDAMSNKGDDEVLSRRSDEA